MYQQNICVEFSQNKNSNSNKPNGNNEEKPVLNLPDILRENLDMIVVGITPSGMLGVSNHHFSGPGNHFWRCIAEVGLVPHQVTCEDDTKMLDYGIGFISFCTRPNKGTTELSRKEMKIGAALMVEKIKKYKPKIVVFNGIGIYEAFIGNKNFSMGLQPNKMEGTDAVIFVMPSSSARCAQLPRAEDKIPFFISLKKLRDHMRGDLPQLEEKEVVFENYTEFRVTQPDPRSLLKAERRRKRKAELSAESALQESLVENSNQTQSTNIEESKPKIQTENELAKDDRNYDPSQNSFSSSIQQNQSAIVNSPLLSWPQNGGLTIIHTGQPIMMPTNGNQTASSNTLLLLDPSGLSFSSIPVPMNPTQLQVRPMILPTDTEQRISQASHLTTVTSIKQNDCLNNLSNTPQNIKARPSSDAQKSIPIKTPLKTILTNENMKTSMTLNPVSIMPNSTNNIIHANSDHKSMVDLQSPTGKPVLMDYEVEKESINNLQSNKNLIVESEFKYNPLNDPNDEWELFMNGIFTGEFSYPAPPRIIPVQSIDAIEEYEQLSQFNVSRILTVL